MATQKKKASVTTADVIGAVLGVLTLALAYLVSNGLFATDMPKNITTAVLGLGGALALGATLLQILERNP